MIPLTLAYWELLGGFLTYAYPPLALIGMAFCTAATLAACMLIYRTRRASWLSGPALLLLAAPAISALANPDLPDTWVIPLFYLGGWGVLVIASHVGTARLLDGLYYAAWLWLFLWPFPFLLGWPVSENITALWGMTAVIVIVAKGKPWWYIIPFCASIGVLGSRSVILGLVVALWLYLRPRFTARQLTVVLGVAIIGGSLLFVNRPATALYRLSYWQQAVSAWAGHNIWFGMGPTGIEKRHAILQPDGSSYQPHAHNIAVQFLTEFGLVGLALLVLAAVMVWRLHPQPGWQAAILAGMLAIGLVDYPFACLGPLLIFAAIAGTMETEESYGYKNH